MAKNLSAQIGLTFDVCENKKPDIKNADSFVF